jgi:hypothetical protein
VATGAYGAIRAYLSERKMRQIDEEKLYVKMDIDFTSDLFVHNNEKYCRAIVSFSNKSLTNVKIISLNIEMRNREDELKKSYHPSHEAESAPFHPIPNQIEAVEIVGINNHKLVNFSNDPRNKEVKVFKTDQIYGLKMKSTEKITLKQQGADVDFDPRNVHKMVNKFIDEQTAKIDAIYAQKSVPDHCEDLKHFFFSDLLPTQIRGLQLFPGETKTQEIILKYKGEGLLYANIESATIRMLMTAIDVEEDFKDICDKIIDSATEFPSAKRAKFQQNLREVITPIGMEIQKQKSNHLLWLK